MVAQTAPIPAEQERSVDRSRHIEQNYFYVTLLSAFTVAGLLVYKLLTTHLLCDELLFIHAIDLGFSEGMFQQGSSHPPLIRLVIGSFSNSSSPDWILRLPSICVSIATVFIWSRILLRMIPDRLVCCLVLPAMAFNPVWLQHGFQCLPYSFLTFFASLHCLAFLKLCEQQTSSRTLMFILTGIALPWTHFYGVNVLIADQFVWFILWWTGHVSLKRILLINLSIAAFTLPMMPIASYYLWNDRTFPLADVSEFITYFIAASSLLFMMVSTPGLETTFPFFLLVYAGVLFYLVRVFQDHRTTENTQRPAASYVGVIAIGFLIAGFTAIQAHSLLSHSAMFPRYMLVGAWVHLPLAAMLLLTFANQKLTRIIFVFVLMSSSIGITDFIQKNSHSDLVADYLKEHWQADDVFLVQSMDKWHGRNHFDQLWFQRYVDDELPITTGINKHRLELHRDGLPEPVTEPTAKRVWVYSHLFKEDWLRIQSVPGWKLAEVHDFGGTYPLALLERTSSSQSDAHSVAIQSANALNAD